MTTLPEPQRDERSQAMNAQKIKELVETYRQPYNGALTAARTELHAAIDALHAKWDALESENRLLRTQLEAAQKDGERYRWLRDNSAYVAVNPHARTCLWTLRDIYEVPMGSFTYAVDAAMAATKGTTP
jgi:Spy/CpxP family protein refolding chaperone